MANKLMSKSGLIQKLAGEACGRCDPEGRQVESSSRFLQKLATKNSRKRVRSLCLDSAKFVVDQETRHKSLRKGINPFHKIEPTVFKAKPAAWKIIKVRLVKATKDAVA